jgi:hypothetical protein
MIHRTTIVIITICIMAFVMIMTFRINIFQISVIQILSLIITLASSSVVVYLLTHLFGLPKKPTLEFEGIIKASYSLSKIEYYLRVVMTKDQGNAEKCMGWNYIDDNNYQTTSIWKDSSKARIITKHMPGDLLLFSIILEEQSHKWIVFPKLREEEAYNVGTKGLAMDEIKKPYNEYSERTLHVIITAHNIKQPIRWSKKVSEIIQTAK